ncbi:hypothetical protein Agabi119p4_2040 [Agaricus bisporus var. burnettii]|uniref:DUF7729 domain-containing protein n=1 Tax=Agaricus bisporus var. burnettii TaxID=192524 RepID=A0A8H7F8P2_AGABI|nr:hypothetical protein Agabi119p4_2040 [Agaricus bisporus var. burnettii]
MLGPFLIASLLLEATLVFAQSLPVSLSSSCSTTLQALLTSPDTACLNLPLLLTYIVDSDKSVPQTINVWLTGLCGNNNTCSNDNIANVVGQVVQGCQEDFAAKNIDIASLQGKITDIAQAVYPTVRKAVCLKDTSSNELCVTQTLENIENVVGKVDIAHINFDTMKHIVQNVLTNATQLACSDCIKAAYNLGMHDFPAQVSKAKEPFEQVCGASFLDGAEPSNIVSTAGQTSSVSVANSNSAIGLKSTWAVQSVGWSTGLSAGLAAYVYSAFLA